MASHIGHRRETIVSRGRRLLGERIELIPEQIPMSVADHFAGVLLKLCKAKESLGLKILRNLNHKYDL